MNILLTGKPGSGKTTLLEKFLVAVPNKQGFIAREVRQNDQRTGFELISSQGTRAILASTSSNSPVKVSRYGINIEEFDQFLTSLSPINADNLLYIDEIGQMQLFSQKFKDLATSYLDAENLFAGTITAVYQDDFTKSVINRSDVVVIRVDESNRQAVEEVLSCLAATVPYLPKLNDDAQQAATSMATKYAADNANTQLKKLFKNAVKYVAEGRVTKLSEIEFEIQGNTRRHSVKTDKNQWKCDCDLFLGKGQFIGNQGDCSHIQAVELVQAIV